MNFLCCKFYLFYCNFATRNALIKSSNIQDANASYALNRNFQFRMHFAVLQAGRIFLFSWHMRWSLLIRNESHMNSERTFLKFSIECYVVQYIVQYPILCTLFQFKKIQRHHRRRQRLNPPKERLNPNQLCQRSSRNQEKGKLRRQKLWNKLKLSQNLI